MFFITFLLVTQGIIESTIINIVAKSIDKIAGSPYITEIPLHHVYLDSSGIMESIPAEVICVKYVQHNNVHNY